MSIKCKSKKNKHFQIGTSGFMIGSKKWSKLDCLNCIEVNSSFYRIPNDKMINNLLELDKNIVIKASKYITHIKRLKDVKQSWNLLWNQIKKLKYYLKCVLFQLPPSFIKDQVNIERIKAMKSYLPNNLKIAFEFRNKSWLDEDNYDLFKKLKWCIVGTFIIKTKNEKWVGDMPPGLYLPPRTTNFNYVRIHGKNRWKGKKKKKQLELIKTKLKNQNTNISFIMFNNSFFDNKNKTCKINKIKIKSAAICNAAQFSNI